MPIRYEGEDRFAIRRARKMIRLSTLSALDKWRMNRALNTLVKVAHDSNIKTNHEPNDNWFLRNVLLDTMTVVKVIMNEPPGDEHESGNSGT